MSRAADLAPLGPPALDTSRKSSKPPQKKTGKKGGSKVTTATRRLRELPLFPFLLANAVMHEPRRRGAKPAEHVKALAIRHGAALSRTLTRRKIPHARGKSPLVTVPFLLAGYYFARMLSHLSHWPHQLERRAVNVAYDGRQALEDHWGSVAFARILLKRPQDQAAWFENCGAAAGWIDKFLYTSPTSLALVRRCASPACRAPFWPARRWTKKPKTTWTCTGACRVALLRAHRGSSPRRGVTVQRSKRKITRPLPALAPSRSPLISRPSAR